MAKTKSELKRADIVAAAKDVLETTGLTKDDDVTPAIDVEGKTSAIKKEVKQAGEFIDPNDKLQDETWKVLEELGAASRPGQGKEDGEPEPEGEPENNEEEKEEKPKKQEKSKSKETPKDESKSKDKSDKNKKQEKESKSKGETKKKDESKKSPFSKKDPGNTRPGIVADALKELDGSTSKDELAQMIDDKYVEKGGSSNIKEAKWAMNTILKFAEQYGIVKIDESGNVGVL